MTIIQSYIDDLQREHQTGQAAEHTYRPALKTLLEKIDESVQALNDPQRSEVGAPDFVVQRGVVPLGIMETKQPGESLARVEKTDQMTRYLKMPNVILTDYLEFRWYVDGDHQQTVSIGQVRGDSIHADSAAYPQLETLLRGFYQNITPTIRTADDLAHRLADLAQLIKAYIIEDMQTDNPSEQLSGQMEAFQKTLLPDLSIEDFADMYAQTITYGMFVARVGYPDDGDTFQRTQAAHHIPQTNPFLRKLFYNINFDLGPRVTWVVDKLADVLAHTAIERILDKFGAATRQEDPVVHFYEDFLAYYDPQRREQRGVYYTPEPVVSYIVRSVGHILRETFGKNGLADEDVMILDPATGTGTFLYFVIEEIRKQMEQFSGVWESYVREALLPRIFGFELMMAPYTVAHLKLGLQLRELGYDFPQNKRLGIYLTNTLQENLKQPSLPMAEYLSKEANAATSIKREKPIMVVLGNPPYSGHSANNGDWIANLHQDYYFVDGKRLKEKNTKWLQNDYVKFIRFGQWRIEQTGSGVLAFITDNSYLDSLTFRGMRQSLMKTFTDIYILDLHGNSRKQETAPDGSPDDNVFDISQGVSIVFFIKEEGKSGTDTIHHLDLYGRRQHKYDWLSTHDILDTKWETITPLSPYYFYIPRDNTMKSEYERAWQITEAMPINVLGFQTHRDYFALDFEKETIKNRIFDLVEEKLSDSAIKQKYELREKKSWQISDVREDLRDYDTIEDKITKVDYRPFDIRWSYYDNIVMDRPRTELMQSVANRDNLCLNLTRQTKLDEWRNVLVSDKPAPAVYVEIKDGSSVFPLYEYPEERSDELFELDDDGSAWQLSANGRRPNLALAFVRDLTARLGRRFAYDDITTDVGNGAATVTPEDIFHYAYAVFHSPTYRQRYAEFLKIDFPRLPLTSDGDLFDALVGYGAELVQYHLMQHADLPSTSVSFHSTGETTVQKRTYDEKAQRVTINKNAYFDNVPPAAWEFHIGGYQVLDKWLKDRKGRALDHNDVRHYAQVVLALLGTQRLMTAIDERIPAFPLT